jgi:hypothetical protein
MTIKLGWVVAVLGSGCADPGATGSGDWELPACDGAADLPITVHDLADGEPIALRSSDIGCHAIVPLAPGNELLAICDGDLHRSTDAGCTWAAIDSECDYQTVVAAPEHGAYGMCSAMGVRRLARIDGAEIDYVEVQWRESTVAVDPQDREHVLLMGIDPEIRRSRDGGDTFTPAATVPSVGKYPGVRAVALDPMDVDHFVTSDWDSVWHTADGGASFTQSTFTFEGETYGNAYMLSLAQDPNDGARVLATGSLRDDELEEIPGSAGVYQSTDGGLTFARTQWPSAHSLVMHPTLQDVYFFVEHEGGDGMDTPPDASILVRVDHGETTRLHVSRVLGSLAFSPVDPDVVYLGAAAPPYGG